MYINGFRVSSSPRSIGIRSYRVPGTSVYLPVRSDVAPLLIGFAREFDQKVERLHKGWCWGYAYRNVRGRSRPSFHSAGLAIDLNAPRHPLGRRGTFSARQRAIILQLARKYGLRWGGSYSGRKDEMHVEVIVSPAVAAAMVRRLQGQPSRTTTRKPVVKKPSATTLASVKYPGKVVQLGWRNSKSVKKIQVKLGLSADGDFGPKTKRAVAAWQRKHHLSGDGKVGPKTWQAMFR